MKKIGLSAIAVIAFALLAFKASTTNITNYPTTTTFDASKWFLLSLPGSATNENLPGNYVASASNLNTVSNSITTTSNALYQVITNVPRGIDWSKTNTVVTNAVALKVPVLTNGSTIFYLILFTNVP